jgi:putative ABC transport system permease protein
MLESVTPGILRFSLYILLFLLLIFAWKAEIFWLALKNLAKNFRRTFILFCVMVSGLTGLIVFFGYAEHSMYNMREATILNGLGHLQIYKKGYTATGNVDKINYNIANYQEISDLLRQDTLLKGKIKGIAAELEFAGIVAGDKSSGDQTSSVFFGKGIEADKDKVLSAVDEIVAGKALEKPLAQLKQKDAGAGLREFKEMFDWLLDPKENQEWHKIWAKRPKEARRAAPAIDDCLIGTGLATALKASPGTTLTVMVSTKSGTLNAVDVHVRGVIRSFSKEYNDSIVKIPLEYAWILMNRKDVSRISVLLTSTEITDAAYQRLAALVAEKKLDLEFTTWREVALYYQSVNSFFLAIFISIGLLITLVVFFSITNVMTMSVMERTRQIGTLRALGQSRGGILYMFLIEGMVIGLLGGLLAILCGIGLAELVSAIGGIPQPPPPGQTKGFQAFLFVTNRPVIWGVAFLLAFFSALLSSLLPARRAARMEITECLRYT